MNFIERPLRQFNIFMKIQKRKLVRIKREFIEKFQLQIKESFSPLCLKQFLKK